MPDQIEVAPPEPLFPVATVSKPSPPVVAVVPPVQRTNGFSGWVSLESWGKLNGCTAPLQVAPGPAPTYEVHSTNRVMAIRVGSRVASCDGFECWLGYAPQMIDGLPHIHALDAQKHLQPLLGQLAFKRLTGGAIVIDPGHGGKDGGTRSVYNGVFEKDYTLDWALRLRPLLAARGWRVALTRSNDLYLSLADRVAVAERAKADFFLSLHFNSGQANSQLAGLETYCLTPSGLPSHLLRSFEDDPSQVYPNNAFDEQNFQLAFGLHRTLLQATGAADRGVRRARFMTVLRGQNRPAVLIEAGYLTNPAEAQRIASPEYRQTLAEAVAKWLE